MKAKRGSLFFRYGLALAAFLTCSYHVIVGNSRYPFIDLCIIVVAVIHLLPFDDEQEIIKRCATTTLFCVGLRVSLWGGGTVQLGSIFLVWFALIGMSMQLGSIAGQTTSGFYFGDCVNASKPKENFSAAVGMEATGNYEGALRIYHHYAYENPDDQAVRLRMALAYLVCMKRKDLAWYWFDKVLDFRRNSECEVVACLEKFKMALGEGRKREAYQIYFEMLRRFPEHVSVKTVHRMLKNQNSAKATPKASVAAIAT